MPLVCSKLDDRVTVYAKVGFLFKRMGIQWNSKVGKYIEYNSNSWWIKSSFRLESFSCAFMSYWLLWKTAFIFKHPEFLDFVKSLLCGIDVIFI